jgi:hypothetical protein
MKPIWARKGSRVKAVVRPRYQWMYLYGFVEPESGKTSWLLMPTVKTPAFSLALWAASALFAIAFARASACRTVVGSL